MAVGPIAHRGMRGAHGFSLLEVVVAMFILSIGAASVLALYAAAVSTHRRSLDRTQAALIAERLFAEVQSRYTPRKTGEDLLAELRDKKLGLPERLGDYAWDLHLFHPAEASGRPGDDSGSAGDDSWSPQELFVRLFIRWKQSGQARSESYYTIMLPRNAGEPGAATKKR